MFFKPIYSAFKEKIHESHKNVIEDLLDIFFFGGGGSGGVLQTFRTLRLGTNMTSTRSLVALDIIYLKSLG